MTGRRLFLGIDCDARGASVVAIESRNVTSDAPSSEPTRVFGAIPGGPTIIHAKTGDGLPYRLDLGDPFPIKRDVGGSPLPERHPWQLVPAESRSAHWAVQSEAMRFLEGQMAPAPPRHLGIVVPDDLHLENADTILKSIRLPRSRVTLAPLPIAAAWSWLRRHEPSLPLGQSSHQRIIGQLIVIHLHEDRWEATPVHLVDWRNGSGLDDAGRTPGRAPRFIPARDRDHDSVIVKAWTENSLKNVAANGMFDDLVRLLDGHTLGVVVTGRPVCSQQLSAIHDLICSFTSNVPTPTVLDDDLRVGLLARGAAHIAALADRGCVTHFESLPRIEVLGHLEEVLEDDHYYGLTTLPYWVDALEGIQEIEVFDGYRKMCPANKLFRHNPKYNHNMYIKSGGRVTIKVAFEGKDVRCISVQIPELKTSHEPVNLQLEYQLGTGRPLLTFQRESYPDEPIVFDWDNANTEEPTRDEVSAFNFVTACEEKKRRERHREELLEKQRKDREEQRKRNRPY